MRMLRSGIGEVWPRQSPFKETNVSAIAAVYIPNCGFVIGADGRARWMDPGSADAAKRQMESDDEQKIFEAATRHGTVAFGITGSAYNDDKSFSVVAECQKAAAALSQSEFANHLEYVERFCEIVRQSIAAVHAENRFDYEPSKICAPGLENMISRFFFWGYFRTRPFAYDAQIINADGILVCNPTQRELREMRPMVLGSGKVWELLYGKWPDKRFLKFAVKVDEGSSQMLAIACVRGYLEACCTPLARKIDPFCEIVGGHIHIATITRQFGFQWATSPRSSK